MKVTIKVTHLGYDYAYVNIYVGKKKIAEDYEVSLNIGEALAKAGATEGEEFDS